MSLLSTWVASGQMARRTHEDLLMMLLKKVLDALSDAHMLNHADDAEDVDASWMRDEVVVDDVARCPGWILDEGRC